MEAAKTTGTDAAALGQRLRSARRQSGLPLREVAERACCSESLLSKVENGRANPSLSMLHRIVAALGMSMTALFGEGDEHPRLVTRRNERPRIRLQSSGARQILLERLVPDTGDHLLQANIHVVAPGGDSQGQITHEGEELGYLLEGSLELIVDGEPYRLEAGDSFLFRSELPHAYRNVGEGEARILWVNTPATF